LTLVISQGCSLFTATYAKAQHAQRLLCKRLRRPNSEDGLTFGRWFSRGSVGAK
jgi:hypothetical protein